VRITQAQRMRKTTTRGERDDTLFEKGVQMHARKIAERKRASAAQ
jgi:hypothetical protein